MKTLADILRLGITLIIGVVVVAVYFMVFTPLWMIWFLVAGLSFDEWLDEWVDKTKDLFTYEWA